MVGNCRGFVGNRMMFPYMREAQFLVEEGATPAQVDRALTDFGMAMGIFAVDDMGGIDVAWRVRQEIQASREAGRRASRWCSTSCTSWADGARRPARGWYRYDDDRKPNAGPGGGRADRDTAREAGIRSAPSPNEEIIERCIYVMINEGARILEEGYAVRAADIDVDLPHRLRLPGLSRRPDVVRRHASASKTIYAGSPSSTARSANGGRPRRCSSASLERRSVRAWDPSGIWRPASTR